MDNQIIRKEKSTDELLSELSYEQWDMLNEYYLEIIKESYDQKEESVLPKLTRTEQIKITKPHTYKREPLNLTYPRYKCASNGCTQAFRNCDDYKNHLKECDIENLEKLYPMQCGECHQRFKRPSYLNKHLENTLKNGHCTLRKIIRDVPYKKRKKKKRS